MLPDLIKLQHLCEMGSKNPKYEINRKYKESKVFFGRLTTADKNWKLSDENTLPANEIWINLTWGR